MWCWRVIASLERPTSSPLQCVSRVAAWADKLQCKVRVSWYWQKPWHLLHDVTAGGLARTLTPWDFGAEAYRKWLSDCLYKGVYQISCQDGKLHCQFWASLCQRRCGQQSCCKQCESDKTVCVSPTCPFHIVGIQPSLPHSYWSSNDIVGLSRCQERFIDVRTQHCMLPDSWVHGSDSDLGGFDFFVESQMFDSSWGHICAAKV